MSKNTFVISDESVNSYGYVVMTDGIDTTAFARNPVMLYMHERKTVVGRWENIRKEGKKLLADAVFDESTDLGRTVKKQVENGFLRSASIGVDIVEKKVINGVETVTKSILFEVSIVDIPANQNALKLYKKGCRLRLALELPKQERDEDLRAAIVRLLGLDSNVSDEVILTEIQHLLNAPDDASIEVEEAIKAGFVESKNRGDFVTMARITPNVFHTFVNSQKEKRKKAVKTAIDAAVSSSKLLANQRATFERIGEVLGLETLAFVLSKIPKVPRLIEVLDGGDRSKWTLDDYRRYRPKDLIDNPKLYAALLKKESMKETANGGSKTLDFLRKYDPDYLKNHPDEYERLSENI